MKVQTFYETDARGPFEIENQVVDEQVGKFERILNEPVFYRSSGESTRHWPIYKGLRGGGNREKDLVEGNRAIARARELEANQQETVNNVVNIVITISKSNNTVSSIAILSYNLI